MNTIISAALTGGGYGWEEDGAFDFEDEPGAEVVADADAVDIPSPVAEAVGSWNGEMESLGNQGWFAGLGEDAQTSVRDGLGAVRTNFQSGFTTATQKLAESRTEFDASKTRLDAQYRKASAWIDDTQVEKGLQELQADNEALRNEHAMYKLEVAAEHRGRVEALRAAGASERQALQTANAEANSKLQGAQSELSEFKTAQGRQSAWQTVERIKTALPGMFKADGKFSLDDGVDFNEGAGAVYDELITLLGVDAITEEQALSYIAHKHPTLAPAQTAAPPARGAPAAPRAATPPPALAAMTVDGAGARVAARADNQPQTFGSSIDRSLQDAARREGRSFSVAGH